MASSWSWKTGEKGRDRVRVYEDRRTGILHAEFYELVPDPKSAGQAVPKRRSVSLGTRDREAAKTKAKQMVAAFAELAAQPEAAAPGRVSLGLLFDIYGAEVTPTKGRGKQRHDRSCMELFGRFFLQFLKGRARTAAAAALQRRGEPGFRWADAVPIDPMSIHKRHWMEFIRQRMAGEIAPAGARKIVVDGAERYPGVGERGVGYDLQWLRAVLAWACVAGDDRAAFLPGNPVAGFEVPRSTSPVRPLLYQEEFEAMLAAVERTPPRKRRRGTSERVPSRAELVRRRLQLVLLNEAGHRGQSVRYLQWTDFDLEGARVRWDARYDKQRREHWTPLSATAVEEVRRARTEIGAIAGWVFPSPLGAGRPMERSAFSGWFRQAAELAGVKRPRLGPHALRRKAATEMAEAGVDPTIAAETLGMSVITYQTIYVRPTETQQRTALAARQPLRAGGSRQ